MDVTVAADNMLDSIDCSTNVLHSIGLAGVQGVLFCWILLGESSLAVVHLHACLRGFPLETSRLSPVDCLRSLSMRIWLFTFRVMQPDASQEDNKQRERWRPKNRFSLA